MGFDIVSFIFITLAVVIVLGWLYTVVKTLVKPGDERHQMMVWKASTVTLIFMILAKVCSIVFAYVTAGPLVSNQLIDLAFAAIVYFVSFMWYKKKYGD